MSTYCFNPNCAKPENPDQTKFCRSCGGKLTLRERYHALKAIGQGGFGKTFLGIDGDKPSKPPCVVKQFLPSSQGTNSLEKAKELFNQEAVRLEHLGKHPQIPELYAHFEQDNYLYLVQEYIDGENLAEQLKDGIFNESQIRELLTNLLPVLDFVHNNQTIHRDIKPENIIQRRTDGVFFVVDFGAARYATGTALLKTGTIIGDPRYMAPEQLAGKANFTSDLYCLGLTCLHLLTLVDPLQLFDTSEDEWVWRDYLTTSVSDELGAILDKMVVKASKKRFQSAQEIWKVLNSAQVFPSTVSTSSQKSVSIPVTPSVSSAPVSQSSKILSSCRKDNKWGYIDENGTFVIAPQYDQAEAFYNGLAKVRIGSQWGMINQSGKIVVPIECNYIEKFSEGLAYVYVTGHGYGFINEKGEMVIPTQFNRAESFNNGLAKVSVYRNNDRWGMINREGKIVIPCEFDKIGEFHQGLAYVEKNGKKGKINEKGEMVIPCEFDEIQEFSNGFADVEKNGKWGRINEQGQLVIPCEFREIKEFSNGLASVRKDGWGVINQRGEIVIPCQFAYSFTFHNGLAEVCIARQWGMINEKGQIVIPCEFDSIWGFSDGLAKVGKKFKGRNIDYWKYGFVNQTGELVIPCEFEEADNFYNGRAKVKKKGLFGMKEGYIDKNGDWIK